MFDIDKWMEERKKEEEIHCPHCGGLYDLSEIEIRIDLITYWGGDDAIILECTHCEKIFYVIEKVRRTFEIYKGL